MGQAADDLDNQTVYRVAQPAAQDQPSPDLSFVATESTNIDDLLRRLDGYNPPDRTVPSQQRISVDIHEAAAAIRANAATLKANDEQIERMSLCNKTLLADVKRAESERDSLREKLAEEQRNWALQFGARQRAEAERDALAAKLVWAREFIAEFVVHANNSGQEDFIRNCEAWLSSQAK